VADHWADERDDHTHSLAGVLSLFEPYLLSSLATLWPASRDGTVTGEPTGGQFEQTSKRLLFAGPRPALLYVARQADLLVYNSLDPLVGQLEADKCDSFNLDARCAAWFMLEGDYEQRETLTRA
jgi:hypothetical protein